MAQAGRYYCFFVVFLIFLSALTLGHLGLLLYQQTRVLPELGVSSEEAFVHSIPTWLPFVVLVMMVGACQPYLCCSWCCEKVSDRRKDTCRIIKANWKFDVYVSLMFGVLTYIIQVIVYLCLDIHLLLNQPPTTGPVHDTYPEIQRMVLYLQICLVVIVLRFPAWIILHHHNMLQDKLSLLNKITKDLKNLRSGKSDSHAQNKGQWKVTVCAALQARKIQKKYRTDALVNTWYAIELCFFCFVEGTDAFTLVEELLVKRDQFATNRALAYSLLTFISLTLIIISVANFLAMHKKAPVALKMCTRLFLVTLSNLPFFIMRIYMLLTFDGHSGADTVFLLFAIKEVVLIVLASTQAGIEIYNGRQGSAQEAKEPQSNLCALDDVQIDTADTVATTNKEQ